MKKIKTVAVVAVIGLAACAFAIGHSRHGVRIHRVLHGHGGVTSTVKHFAEAFPLMTSFDANKNGELDANETESIAKALAEGRVQAPAHTLPNGEIPSREMILNHVPEMYVRLVPYDANRDGTFDGVEQEALKTAIEKGGLSLSHPK